MRRSGIQHELEWQVCSSLGRSSSTVPHKYTSGCFARSWRVIRSGKLIFLCAPAPAQVVAEFPIALRLRRQRWPRRGEGGGFIVLEARGAQGLLDHFLHLGGGVVRRSTGGLLKKTVFGSIASW